MSLINHTGCITHCSSPSDDERSAEVVLPDALSLLVAVGGGLADAAQARQRDNEQIINFLPFSYSFYPFVTIFQVRSGSALRRTTT